MTRYDFLTTVDKLPTMDAEVFADIDNVFSRTDFNAILNVAESNYTEEMVKNCLTAYGEAITDLRALSSKYCRDFNTVKVLVTLVKFYRELQRYFADVQIGVYGHDTAKLYKNVTTMINLFASVRK